MSNQEFSKQNGIVLTPEHYKEIFTKHYDGLFRMMYRMVGQHTQAEDLVQEAFVRLYTHWQEIDPLKTKAWLFQVASNLGLNALRNEKRRRLRQREAATFPGRANCTVEQHGKKMDVHHILGQMPERQSKLLMLYMAGLSHQEIADATGLKKSSLSRMLLDSKRTFEQMYQSCQGEN